MRKELDLLRRVRPQAAAPTSEVRRAALRQLLAAVEDEPPGLHAHHALRGVPVARTRRGMVRPRYLGSLVSVTVVVVVVIGALVLLGHRGSTTPTPVSVAGHGTIETAGGSALTGVPAPIAAGLRHEYRAALRAGQTVHTSLDLALERAGERSLRHSIAVNHGSGGAFVALNPTTGAVEAIGTAATTKATRSQDRAVSSAGPIGSAITPITALAALSSGAWSPGETYYDTGKLCLKSGCVNNPGEAAYGALSLPQALTVDANTFFDNLGARLNTDAAAGGALQRWARRFGLGSTTGIDLPDTSLGFLPTPTSVTKTGTGVHWSVGNNINLAIGQGNLQISPIQLAVAYAAIANGGAVLIPHIADTHNGAVELRGHLHLSTADLAAVTAGLHGSADGTKGTTQQVFRSFTRPVMGEPGSTQIITHGREVTNAWYAGYSTTPGTSAHALVVVVFVQGGGYGAIAAAPVARQLLSQWTYGHPGKYVPGDSIAR